MKKPYRKPAVKTSKAKQYGVTVRWGSANSHEILEHRIVLASSAITAVQQVLQDKYLNVKGADPTEVRILVSKL